MEVRTNKCMTNFPKRTQTNPFFNSILVTGTAIVTERGCAHQSLSYRVLKRGQWQTVNDVNETVYQDGCILEHQTSKPPTQYCYCSSRLCNSAPSIATLNPFILLYLALICSSFTLL